MSAVKRLSSTCSTLSSIHQRESQSELQAANVMRAQDQAEQTFAYFPRVATAARYTPLSHLNKRSEKEQTHVPHQNSKPFKIIQIMFYF